MKHLIRYELKIEPKQDVMVPFGGEFMGITEYEGTPFLWYAVDKDNMPNARKIVIAGEGNDLDYRCNRTKLLGHFRTEGKVLHVFDLT